LPLEQVIRAIDLDEFLWFLSTCVELAHARRRYPVTEARLMELTAPCGGELIDPLKITLVQNPRAMTTWIMRKR
jgi:hypothetical protein